jgi:hypothetical protein
MDDREITLANFQAATGIDDITYCIELLEKNDWNLVQAISLCNPPSLVGEATGPYFSPISNPSFKRQDGEANGIPTGVQRDSVAPTGDHLRGSFTTQKVTFGGNNNGVRGFQPVVADGSASNSILKPPISTGLPARRQIHLRIEWRDKTFPIIVNDDDIIERVKRSLEGHTGVPVEKQMLKGWPGMDNPPDMVRFVTLKSQTDIFIVLLVFMCILHSIIVFIVFNNFVS